MIDAFLNSNDADVKVNINLEKADNYALGMTFLRLALLLLPKQIADFNNTKLGGDKRTKEYIEKISDPIIKKCLKLMLEHDEKKRATY